tara:strand:- start:346 stop:1005 length:660 start_codon:yes stop_codon:yes gene_type:complete
MFSKEQILKQADEQKRECEERGDIWRASENLALLIFSSALFDQKQWNGDDYAAHPLYVGYNGTRSTTKRIIGILHDVVEDSDWELDDLRKAGFSERVILGVESVTKREGEFYFDFIERCSCNPDGIDVKLNDLEHNMNMFRNDSLPSEKDMVRLQKYVMAKEYLVAVKKGEIHAGSPFADFVGSTPALNNNSDAWEILEKESLAGKGALTSLYNLPAPQ